VPGAIGGIALFYYFALKDWCKQKPKEETME